MSNNKVRDLAVYFITVVMGRKMTPADYRGRHMKTASRLLKEMKYDYDAVIAALAALKRRDYKAFGYDIDDLPKGSIQGMEILYLWGEPPLIERFVSPPPMPPIYSCDFDEWVRQWGKLAIERGDWDGLYIRRDPNEVPWLMDIIGERKHKESVRKWQTQQRTSPPKNRLSDGLQKTPPL